MLGRFDIWRSWVDAEERNHLGVVLKGYRSSVWDFPPKKQVAETSRDRHVHTNAVAIVFFICVGLRYFPFGLLPALLMVALEVLTIFISLRFISWVVSSLYGDFHGGCTPDKYKSILAWSCALQAPMLLGAILGVWTEPWIAFPLLRVLGMLYGVVVLRQFFIHEMKFPVASLKKIWCGVSAVWILILLGARILSLSIMAPVWVDALLG
tara:strand:+ start:138 stop:764 length:627 start_codon:yes stop_codon:yes gene_type:complete